jgi:hypothetical protein
MPEHQGIERIILGNASAAPVVVFSRASFFFFKEEDEMA